MPKENQKRGRRMKRKHEEEHCEDQLPVASNKRRKSKGQDDFTEESMDYMLRQAEDADMSAAYGGSEMAFFGILDEEEQAYFKGVDDILEQNAFHDAEERMLYLNGVHREIEGKELKLAQSQSCSRILERIMRISTASQLKGLFQKFNGNFIHLLSHRFASHVCESLFTYAAPIVSEELKAKPRKPESVDEVYVSMENLFLHTLAELEGNFGFLLTDRYASHALRTLLLVLSGRTISTDSTKSLLGSKRKEGNSPTSATKGGDEAVGKPRAVPESFSAALEKLISDSVAGLDTNKLRGLATHPNANPTLQLLLTLELTHYGKQRAQDEHSIIKTLLPDDPFTAETESAAFISGLVYDTVGSHLLETVIENAPSKLFKSLYRSFFKERLVHHAKNEVATHVVCRILARLGYDDLLEAHEILLPVLPTLLERHWTALPRTLIERCTIRDIDTQAIAALFEEFYRGPDGFDITQLLRIDNQESETNGTVTHTNQNTAAAVPEDTATMFYPRPADRTKVHFNILAQAMLIVPGSLSALVLDSLISLDSKTLLSMAKDHIVTRTLQQALTTKNASIIQRRKLIQRFYGNIGEMALDKAASHAVDCIWEGTHGLAFIRERIAEELNENEAELRDSACGRAVWKNWKMDIYKRKRHEWVRQSKIKASNDGFQSFSELDKRKNEKEDAPRKTPLQMARERHMHAKVKQENGIKRESTPPEKMQKSRSRSSKSSAGPSRPARAPATAAST